jgi:hypothetical protein
MDADTVQLITGTVGVAGTLAGALLSQLLARRNEKDRWVSENRSRWLEERLRLNSELLSNAIKIEREMFSAASFLTRDPDEEKALEFTSIYMIPEDRIDGVLDGETRSILVEALEDAWEASNSIETLIAQVELPGTPKESKAANELYEQLLNIMGMVESFADFDTAYDTILAGKEMRERFARASRLGLGGLCKTLFEEVQPDCGTE